MPYLCTPAYSLGFIVVACALAWISGAVFGWGLRETIAWFASLQPKRLASTRGPLLAHDPVQTPSPPLARRRRRRHGGYYFSEETRRWGSRRWRRRLGWMSAATIVVVIGGSLLVAIASYKPHKGPPASSGGRHHLNGRL